MNERIERITKQVDEYFDDLSIEFSRQAWMEKFAELIVRECCDIFVELRTRPADLAVKDVKKHFGVEE